MADSLTDQERQYLQHIIYQRYANTDKYERGDDHDPKRYREDLKSKYNQFGKSDSDKDFQQGIVPGAKAWAPMGGVLGYTFGASAGGGRWPGKLLGALGGGALGAGIGGLTGGAGRAREGGTVRSLALHRGQATREGDRILKKDRDSINNYKTFNRVQSISSLAGLATAPLHAALSSSIPLMSGQLDEMDDKHWGEITKHLGLDKKTTGKEIVGTRLERDGSMLRGWPDHTDPKVPFWREVAAYDPDVKDHRGNDSHGGIGATSTRMMSPGILAHELGHAHIHKNKGIVGTLQDKLYGFVHPHSVSGKMYGVLPTALTQLATKDDDSVGVGAAKGTAIAGAAYAPLLIPEFEASRRGIGAIMKSTLPMKAKLLNSALMLPGLATYGLATLGPSAAVGGYNAHENKLHAAKEKAKLAPPSE